MTSLPIVNIRTSDRIAFKRCRRKWGFSSHLRLNRTEDQARAPLWSGTGFHFAMEDFHGHNRFGDPRKAFMAYVAATQATPLKRVPEDLAEQIELVHGMIDYYLDWLSTRDHLKTFVYEGKPQVEVNFQIPIPLDPAYVEACGYSQVMYSGTIDRVVEDEYGRLWVLDYKTAKSFVTSHLDTDPQIGAYLWAGSVLYPGRPFAGFVYQQHLKKLVEPPKYLSSRRMFSTAKTQATTHKAYSKALKNLYGDIKAAKPAEIEYLNFLATEESPDMDAMIRRDWEFRNETQISAEGAKILMEAADMINPELPMYPNPTRDCAFDCSFKMSCIMMDDGSDWEGDLLTSTIARDDKNDNWRKYLIWPNNP